MNSEMLNEKLNKDFYNDLPNVVGEVLDSLIEKYGPQTWFMHAWNEYHDYALNSSVDDLRMPGYIFNKYIGGEEIKHSFVSEELEDDELWHYGIKRRSGRYPWGSGENPYQRSEDFYVHINKLRDEGISDKEIVSALGLANTKELRFLYEKSKDDLRRDKIAYIKSAKADGKSNIQIGIELGEKYNPDHSPIGESTVRSLLDSDREARMNRTALAAKSLKEIVDDKRMLDVGIGVEKELGISKDKLDNALMILEYEYGYHVYPARVPQATNKGQYTTIRVLTKPDVEEKEIHNFKDIGHLSDYTSHDGGDTFVKSFQYPASMDSKRLKIKYAEDEGVQRDGLIQIRRNVKDLSLGESNYAQVRILVDDKYYLKGMAVYGEDKDFPDGVDVIFNSNKSKERGMEGALKSVKDNLAKDPNNPFGSSIKEGVGPHGGQSYYIDDDGKQKLSLINKRSDEADWGDWSKETPSQFLSKQPVSMIKRQLNLAVAHKETEFEDILEVNNPTVKKQLLEEFADKSDRAAIDLKGAPLPGQKYQVILPIPSLKDNECYAPNYPDGAELALIRYPHGGTFEIPIVKVNNRNKEGKSVITPNGKDAIGINMNVAQRLSGADFDGDTVMVIPISEKVKVKSTDPLPGLKGFDPSDRYGPDPKQSYEDDNGVKHYVRNGIEYPIMTNTQMQMGIVSNLITDMTIKGATDEEKARAVRHSMVVIDAEKHKLDWRQSEIDNGISELKKKYQTQVDPETGKTHQGASTLISKAKSPRSIPERKLGAYIALDTGNELTKISDEKDLYLDEKTGIIYTKDQKRTRTIDPETGKKLYRNTNAIYYETKYKDANGKTQTARVYEKDGKLLYKNKSTGKFEEVTYDKVKQKQAMESKPYMELVDDANQLSAGYTQEILYAEYANKMKALANQARKEALNTKSIPYSPSARIIYKEEVKSLDEKLDEAERNAPRERHAQMIADSEFKAIKQDNPRLTDEEQMKIRTRLITSAREAVGAKRHEVYITDNEYKAIQAGAISPSKLSKILKVANSERLKQLATPRNDKDKMTRSQVARLKRMSNIGYTNEEVAKALGISVSTVVKYLSGKEN